MIIMETRSRLSVVKRLTLCWSPSPIAREITAEAPIPIPKEKLINVKVTGKVKLIATNSRTPIRLM